MLSIPTSAPNLDEKDTKDLIEATLALGRITGYVADVYSEIVKRDALHFLETQENWNKCLLNDRFLAPESSERVYENFCTSISQKAQETQESLQKEIAPFNDVTLSNVEQSLELRSQQEQQYLYLFLNLLMFQGTYTAMGSSNAKKAHLVSFWYPVENEEREVVLAVCEELFFFHLNRLVEFLDGGDHETTELEKERQQEICLRCKRDFLEHVHDINANVSKDKRIALRCAFGAISKPSILYLQPNLLLNMFMFLKRQKDEYGITGFPFRKPPTLNLFEKFWADPTPLDSSARDVFTTLETAIRQDSIENWNSEKMKAYSPLPLSKEIVDDLAFSSFFKTSLFSFWAEELKLDKLSYLRKDQSTHLLPLWKIPPTDDKSQLVQPWMQDLSQALLLSPALLVRAWEDNRRGTKFKFPEWQRQIKPLQSRWIHYCQEKEQNPDTVNILPRDFSQEVTDTFTKKEKKKKPSSTATPITPDTNRIE
jgi:hypothetical protein